MSALKMARVVTKADPHDARTAPAVDADSIAAEKAYQQRERAAITEQTGIRFIGDRMVAPPYIIRCPQCVSFAAVTRSEGRAYRALATHLVVAHVPQEVA
jgi:hypothetical protein